VYPLLEKRPQSQLHPDRRNTVTGPAGDGEAAREAVSLCRPAVLEGAELWSVARLARPWTAFHTTYMVGVPRRLEGRQQWRCDGRTYDLGLTSTLLLEPGALAVATAETAADLDFLLVPAHLMNRALAAWALPGSPAGATVAGRAADGPTPDLCNTLVDDAGLVGSFDHLRRALESAAPDPQEQKARLDALLRLLVERVHPLAVASENPSSRCSRALDHVRAVVTERFAERITLDSLALDTGFSKFYLERSFNDRFGVPIHQFLKRVRIGMALAMMREGSRPSSVARTVGFADQPHMTRVFRDELGITPRTYWAASRPADIRRPRKGSNGDPGAAP
jgi:AraC-like DNA-binding protein